MKRNGVILAGAMAIAFLTSPLAVLGAADSPVLSDTELNRMLVDLENNPGSRGRHTTLASSKTSCLTITSRSARAG